MINHLTALDFCLYAAPLFCDLFSSSDDNGLVARDGNGSVSSDDNGSV